jgi:hypothetical protein
LRAEVELLLEQAPDPEVRAALERMRRSLAGMSTLVERLLVLAGPRVPLQGGAEAVSVADLVSEARAERDDRDRERFVLRLNDEGLVRGDPALLRTLVDNALENALKFSDVEPVEVFVDSATAASFSAWSIAVPGFRPRERERVFEAFYRSAAARAHTNGYGVGLALIAHVAQAHGGEVAFDDVARGASLRVRLPIWQPDARRDWRGSALVDQRLEAERDAGLGEPVIVIPIDLIPRGRQTSRRRRLPGMVTKTGQPLVLLIEPDRAEAGVAKLEQLSIQNPIHVVLEGLHFVGSPPE